MKRRYAPYKPPPLLFVGQPIHQMNLGPHRPPAPFGGIANRPDDSFRAARFVCFLYHFPGAFGMNNNTALGIEEGEDQLKEL